jgi:hypothetical protein
MNRVRLTSARGRDIHFFVRGRVDRESAPGDIRSSAKRKFLTFVCAYFERKGDPA